MKTALIIFLVLALTVLAAFSGYLFVQNQKLAQKIGEVALQQSVKNPETENPVAATPQEEVTPKKEMPPVVFTPGGRFQTNVRSEIQTKIIDPFLDYHLDTGLEVASIEVSENTQNSKATYPYLFSAILKNGGNEGFTIGSSIDWWLPECMGPCPLTAAFKTKYPEIVKKLSQ